MEGCFDDILGSSTPFHMSRDESMVLTDSIRAWRISDHGLRNHQNSEILGGARVKKLFGEPQRDGDPLLSAPYIGSET